MSSTANTGQHSDPVWQVRWVDRGQEQEERLVTISTDGRVTQWATTKASDAGICAAVLLQAWQVYLLQFCQMQADAEYNMCHL